MSRRPYDYTYISLGAGVQSSALLVMSNLGMYECPRADAAIFADTQSEPQWVYDQLERLEKWSEIPVEVVTRGALGKDAIDRRNGTRKRFAALPLFTHGTDRAVAVLRRQCTREYKIEPIEKRLRAILGYRPRQRIKEHVRALLGISIEEPSRMKPSRTRWITNEFPLIDSRRSRMDCLAIMNSVGLPAPRKSACVFCPYRSNEAWREMRDKFPEEWEKACDFDESVRDMSRSGASNPVFVHRSLRPLREAPIDTDQTDMFDEECFGVCGV